MFELSYLYDYSPQSQKLRHPSNVKNVSSGIEVNETISVRQTCRGNNVKNEPLGTKITFKK